jgi:hypothetical protein
MQLSERQESLQENYYFSCQCSSCSELNLSDLVMNSFCCPQSNCLGAISESTYYRSKENFVNVSLGGSYVCKLSLPVRLFSHTMVFLNIFSFTPLVTNKWPFRLQHGLQNTTLNTTFATVFMYQSKFVYFYDTIYFVTPDKIYSCYF